MSSAGAQTADGTLKGYDLRKWHAKGVGPLKVVGEIYLMVPGKPRWVFHVDATLQSATVARQAIVGDGRR